MRMGRIVNASRVIVRSVRQKNGGHPTNVRGVNDTISYSSVIGHIGHPKRILLTKRLAHGQGSGHLARPKSLSLRLLSRRPSN